MSKLVIEQEGYHKVEFEFEDSYDAATVLEMLKPYAKKKTTLSIVDELEGEQE